MRTDAEHRALDERLDILTWGLVIMVIALILFIPGVHKIWYYLLPTGVVFTGMSVVRKVLRTRRDTEGLLAGIVLMAGGVFNLFGMDFQYVPLVPLALLVLGVALLGNAVVSDRVRKDPTRPAE